MKKLIAAMFIVHICNSGAMAQFIYCQPPQQIVYCPPQQYRSQQVRIPNVSESRTYQPAVAANKSSTFEPSTATPRTKPAAPRFETDDAADTAKPSSFVPMTDEYKEEIMKEIRSLRNEMREFRERLDKIEKEKGGSKGKEDVGFRVRHKSTW